jgi:hypothetical protein
MAHGMRRAMARVLTLALALTLAVGTNRHPVAPASSVAVPTERSAPHGHPAKHFAHRPSATDPRSAGLPPSTTADQRPLAETGISVTAVPPRASLPAGLPNLRAPPEPAS